VQHKTFRNFVPPGTKFLKAQETQTASGLSKGALRNEVRLGNFQSPNRSATVAKSLTVTLVSEQPISDRSNFDLLRVVADNASGSINRRRKPVAVCLKEP
jgi:hypothetical protein